MKLDDMIETLTVALTDTRDERMSMSLRKMKTAAVEMLNDIANRHEVKTAEVRCEFMRSLAESCGWTPSVSAPRKPYVKDGHWIAQVGDKFRVKEESGWSVSGKVCTVTSVYTDGGGRYIMGPFGFTNLSTKDWEAV